MGDINLKMHLKFTDIGTMNNLVLDAYKISLFTQNEDVYITTYLIDEQPRVYPTLKDPYHLFCISFNYETIEVIDQIPVKEYRRFDSRFIEGDILRFVTPKKSQRRPMSLPFSGWTIPGLLRVTRDKSEEQSIQIFGDDV